MKFYTYLHCKPDGTPFYIGKGNGRRARRFDRRNKMHRDIVAHYGVENIRIFIFKCESEDQALADEIQQITQFRREGLRLANFNDGGEGQRNPSKEVRAKLSAAMLGKPAWNRGRSFSEETKKRMSEAAKRRPPISQERLDALHLAACGNRSRTGMKNSIESNVKSSAALKGNTHMLGKIMPEEVRAKIAASVVAARALKFWSSKRLQGTAT